MSKCELLSLVTNTYITLGGEKLLEEERVKNYVRKKFFAGQANSMKQNLSGEANRASASQEIPAVYGTRRFVTAFTNAHHLSPSCAGSNQSMKSLPAPFSSILILLSYLRLGLPSGLSLSYLSYMICA